MSDPAEEAFPSTVDDPTDWQAKVAAAREHYSDQEIARFLLAQPQAKAARDAGHSDQDILGHFGLKVEGEAKPETKVTWGPSREAPDAAVLGQGTKVMALAQGAKAAVLGPWKDLELSPAAAEFLNPFTNARSKLRATLGTPGPQIPQEPNPLTGAVVAKYPTEQGSDTFGSTYQQSKDAYEGARGAYTKENPLTSLAIDAAASTPALVAGGAGLTAGLRAGGGVLGPAITDFVTGAAGYGPGGRALPGLARFGQRVAGQGVTGAIQGGAMGGMASGLDDGSLGGDIARGAAVGGPFGAILGPVGNRIVNAWRGPELSPGVAEAGLRAVGPEGIPLRMNNLTGASTRRDQISAFTRSLAQTIGEDSDQLTPQVMDRAATRIGQTLDRAGVRTGIAADPDLATDFGRVAHAISISAANPAELRPLAQELVRLDGLITGGGSISGADYQAIINRGSTLDKLLNSRNADVAHLARDLRDALRDGVVRTSGPDAAAELTTARGQWKNLKTLQHVTENNPLVGQPTPDDMRQLTSAIIQRNPEFFRGRAGQLGNLAEIGQQFLSAPMENGQAWQRSVHGAALALSEAGMGAIGHYFALDPVHAAALLGFPATVSGAAAAMHWIRNSPRFARNALMRGMMPEQAQLGGRTLLPAAAEAANQNPDAVNQLTAQ